jgi:hypothetical protein
MNWRKSKQEITSPAFVRSLALELREMVAEEADLMAEGLAAIEAVWRESEEELGVDLIHPEVKGAVSQASQALADLRLELGKRRRWCCPRRSWTGCGRSSVSRPESRRWRVCSERRQEPPEHDRSTPPEAVWRPLPHGEGRQPTA